MKKALLLLSLISILTASCGDEKGQNKPNDELTKTYSVKENTAILKWTAFKTTDRVAVGGEFTEVKLKKIPQAEQLYKSVEGLEFSIPVSSLFTNNDSRDEKLKSKFFAIMINTDLITGTFKNLEGDDKSGQGLIDLKMNDVSCDLPFDYTIKNDEFKLTSSLNILSWKGQNALDSINSACYDLHKGADGISKTWEDVDINASIEIEKK